MSDAMNPATAEGMPAEAVQNATDGDDKSFKLDDVKRKYFSPDNLEEGVSYVNQIIEIGEVDIKRNFKEEDDFPEGFGLGVIPISVREGDKNVVKSVAVCAIPDVSIVVNHEKGQQFISDVVQSNFLVKAANAFRVRPDGGTAATVPETLEDFITSMKGREGLKTFTEIASTFVRALKKKGIKFMTPALLRQTLQSSQFASGQFEKIEQASWVKILDSMIAYAKTKQLDTSILEHWKNTRDEKEAVEIDDDVISGALEELV